MDGKWWTTMGPDVAKVFKGEWWAHHPTKYTHAGNQIRGLHCKRGGNSGCGAMYAAAANGAQRIFLFGADCTYAKVNGKERRHWHGDHNKALGNAVSVPMFYNQFKDVHRVLFKIMIVNCSPISKIDFWPKIPYEDALWPDGKPTPG